MTISHIKAAVTETLSEPAPVGSPIGTPVAHVSYKEWDRPDQVETGIWECTPGRWNRAVTDQEFCHFIAGAGTFTPTGGEPIPFKAGDAFILSANTFGVWDITETVRKTYVLIKR